MSSIFIHIQQDPHLPLAADAEAIAAAAGADSVTALAVLNGSLISAAAAAAVGEASRPEGAAKSGLYCESPRSNGAGLAAAAGGAAAAPAADAVDAAERIQGLPCTAEAQRQTKGINKRLPEKRGR